MGAHFADANLLAPHPAVRTLALVQGGIRVVVRDERNGMAHRLDGVVAATWIVLDRPTAVDELRSAVCAALAIPSDNAHDLIDAALDILWRQGLLEGSDAPDAASAGTRQRPVDSQLLRREPDP